MSHDHQRRALSARSAGLSRYPFAVLLPSPSPSPSPSASASASALPCGVGRQDHHVDVAPPILRAILSSARSIVAE